MANPVIGFYFTMRNEDSSFSGVVTPEPKGAKARFGINSLAHPEAITDGFYTMSKAEAWAYAMRIYITQYWNVVEGDEIVPQLLANKIADLAFDMNPPEVVKITQRAANSLLGHVVLKVDGVMGPKTLEQVNGLDRTLLYDAIKSYARQRYQDIARANPEDQKYLNGWLRRVDA